MRAAEQGPGRAACPGHALRPAGRRRRRLRRPAASATASRCARRCATASISPAAAREVYGLDETRRPEQRWTSRSPTSSRRSGDAFARLVDEKIAPAGGGDRRGGRVPARAVSAAGRARLLRHALPGGGRRHRQDVVTYCLAVRGAGARLAVGRRGLHHAVADGHLLPVPLGRRGDPRAVPSGRRWPASGSARSASPSPAPAATSGRSPPARAATAATGDHGQKTWITSAPVADFFTVFARAGDEKQLTIFLVEARCPASRSVARSTRWASGRCRPPSSRSPTASCRTVTGCRSDRR